MSDRPEPLIDATEVARRLGVTRSFVYEHRDELGAIRIGSGSRPRLRFDPARLAAPEPQPKPAAPRRRRRSSVELLPIKSNGGST